MAYKTAISLQYVIKHVSKFLVILAFHILFYPLLAKTGGNTQTQTNIQTK